MKKLSFTARFVLPVILIAFCSYEGVRTWQDKYNKLPVYGGEITGKTKYEDLRIKTFELTNQDNQHSGTESWKGKIVVVNFFFTHCAGICPKMTINLKKVQAAYYNDHDVFINSLTVDPTRDSSAELSKYATSFGINKNQWQLLTGDKREIYRLARNEFRIVAADGDGGPNDFIHSEQFVLVDPQQRIRGYYNGTDAEAVNQLIKDIEKLKHEN